MIKRIFTVLYHFTWYAVAFIVLTAAVLVTVIRLALPEIGGYKNEIQSWVSEYMDYPVVIDEITAEWQGWAPHLYLKKIDLYTPDNNSLISKFDSAHLGIDLFSSINKRELVPNQLSISGLNLKFTRNTDGSISINDNQSNTPASNSDNTALSVWLLKQKHITLENANLTWHDKKANKEPQEFSNVQLDLKTKKERLQISAYIALPEDHGSSLTIKMDVTGNVLTPDWKGTIYAEAKEVNPTGLLKDFPVKSIGGIANARLWSNWDKAKLINVSGEMDYSGFSLDTDEYNLAINNINLNLYVERQQDKDWLLNVSVEDLQTENGLWPASTYQLIAELNNENNYSYRGHLSYLKLDEVVPFLVAANVIPDIALEKIHWQALKGELTNSNFGFNPESGREETVSFNTVFKNLALISHDKINVIYGLDGSLNANNKLTKIILDSKSTEIHLDSFLDKPLLLSALNANLEIVNNDSIELLIKEFHIEDKHISAQSSGSILFHREDSPFIDVVARINPANIEYLPAYLPRQTSAKLRHWFNLALAGGQLLSGDLIYRGQTKDFPFNNAEGNFKAILNVENVNLNYAEGWPPIDNVTAEVIIDNDDLYVSSKSAYIFDATIDGFTANIKQLGTDNPHVVISGTATGHTSDAGHFITQSPLNENSSLRELTENILGGIDIKLDLDIPIGPGETLIKGLISFTDTTIESGLPGLGLEGVNGDVSFTRQATWATDIDALYHGKPVKLNIPKFDQFESDSESYVISGKGDKDFFTTELTSFFPSLQQMADGISNKLSGKSNWSLALNKSGTTNSREVEFNSDLKGLAIELPFPLGKTTEEIKSLSIKTRLTDLLINEININYDNNLFADFNVDNKGDFIVKNILVGLGHKHPTSPTSSDISIQGELEKINVTDWVDFFNLEKISVPQNNKTSMQKTISGNVYTKSFKMLGNEFSNVNINLSKPASGWQILFDSEELKGQTNFIAAENNRVHARFEKLTLKKSDDVEDEKKNQIAIDKIPELDVNVDEFTYNENKLGQLSLLTRNVKNGININNLSIIKPGFHIIATGEWVRLDDIDRSDFHARLKADSIETMLTTFNFDAANIKEGQTNIEMNAYWMDTPMNFAMEKIDGELDMKIGKGQFLDINPSAGRLFGLLSLQTLPRRLSLDFSDLFEEGFSFDSIEGNFSLQQGHAYTNNLEMTGPSADIIVSGRTGLSTEDYDQIATVTPKISSGLPVASALFGPVGVGVGAVIYLASELFESIPKKIDQILSAQYTITGSWDHPNVEKIKEEKDSG